MAIELVLPPHIPPWVHGAHATFRLDVGALRIGVTEKKVRAVT